MPPDRRRNALDPARIEATMPGETDIRLYDGEGLHLLTEKRIPCSRRASSSRSRACSAFLMSLGLESDGTLAIRLGRREVTLTPGETTELRRFLDATRTVAQGAESC